MITKVCMSNWFTNGPPAMEQTEAGDLDAENSDDEEIVGRRKFSGVVPDGCSDGARERCFCSLEAPKHKQSNLSFQKKNYTNIVYFES